MTDFLKAIEVAVTNRNSSEHAGLYEVLWAAFIKVDSSYRGEIIYGEFSNRIEKQPKCLTHSVRPILVTLPGGAQGNYHEFLLAAFVPEIDTSWDADFYHVASYSGTVLLEAFQLAVTSKDSLEHASLYEFLLAAFAELDWMKESSIQPSSKTKRDFYDFLHRAFGDVNVDNDGKLTVQ